MKYTEMTGALYSTALHTFSYMYVCMLVLSHPGIADAWDRAMSGFYLCVCVCVCVWCVWCVWCVCVCVCFCVCVSVNTLNGKWCEL